MSKASCRVLLIKHGSLGDIFLMLGALQDVAESSGGPVDVLTMAPYAKIFKRSPFVNRVYVDNRKSRFNLGYLWQLKRVFYQEGYDQVIDLQNSKRTKFYRQFLAPNLRWCQVGTIAPTNFSSSNTASPVIAKLEAQLEGCGFGTSALLEGDLSWLCDPTEASDRVSNSSKSVVLLPGASAKHTHKIWPRYAELAQLLQCTGHDVFVVPGPDDMDLCQTIPGELLLSGDRWLDFFQLAGVLAQADFVVGNDSGPTHLAASLGSRGVALFSERTDQHAPNMRRREMDVCIAAELQEISAESILERITSPL